MVKRFYFNHVGLEPGAGAQALLHREEGEADTCEVLTTAGELPIAELKLGQSTPSFRGTKLCRLDLSELPAGRYALRYQGELSPPFHVEKELLLKRTLSSVLGYFREQRCEDPWNTQDHTVPFFGNREGTVDVHGGWYDASGDLSKYMSHLSYANYMNPQQTPLVVWGLLEHLERRAGRHAPGLEARLRDEARHGADFLERMQDDAGYFYMTVFDQWSKGLDRRLICAFKTQKGEMLEGYQCGYRQGGGVAIAALARAGRVLGQDSFITYAKKGFRHLEEHGLKYLDDGQENIIDDYCALLAATELQAAAPDPEFLAAAERRAGNLVARLQTSNGPAPGWLRADDGERPFYHAADAGLPVIALLRFAEVCHQNVTEIIEATEQMMRFELAVTAEQENAFGYARQFIQDASGNRRSSFFIPHQNETEYWWQGENARLSSLAAAAARVAHLTSDTVLKEDLLKYAHSQLDWICGKNPFDSCMVHGFGRNNGNYMDKWPNVLGGICNGITAGFDDESDVDFGRTDLDGDHGWRWHEQWLPHAAWFVIALSELHPSSAA